LPIKQRTSNLIFFKDFPSIHYPGLNGSKQLTASKADIKRSLLMVGYLSSGDAITQVGLWRATLLNALVEGYLTHRLQPTNYFLSLEPSERVSMTFLIGQAFTHWVADAHMSIPILLHVIGASPKWGLAPLPMVGKNGSGPVKNKSRPDFIGISPSGFHVFESKGRSVQAKTKTKSSTIASSCMKDALAQVSRISLVNGRPPVTRTASVWILRPGGTEGFITDPPKKVQSFDLDFDLRKALLNYYRIVLDAPKIFQTKNRSNFIRFHINTETYLFFEPELQETILRLEKNKIKAKEVLNYLEGRSAFYTRLRRSIGPAPSISFGLDGVGLVSKSDPELG
jgi:hypothetical protein